jgi:peptidyl-prolyl cis-trans isomerase A (cyclophilin A)
MDATFSKETSAEGCASGHRQALRVNWRVACVVAVAASCGLSCGLHKALGNTLVDVDTNMGSFEVDLFDDVVPDTVAHFLAYSETGAYSNTLIHQIDTPSQPGNNVGAVLGGGFGVNPDTGDFVHIPTFPPTALAYHVANARGTIAMARGPSPNSATSDWLVNTIDNSVSLGPANNGGFTVFGQIVAGGMSTIDSIYALPQTSIVQTAKTFDGFPLRNYDTSTNPPVTPDNYVLTNSITILGTHPSFLNPIPANRNDVNNDGVVHPDDALAIIDDLLSNGSHAATAQFVGTTYFYVDVNGDGNVFPQDALQVIDALEHQSPLLATASPMALAATTLSVPEPSSLALAAIAALGFAGVALCRARENRTCGIHSTE